MKRFVRSVPAKFKPGPRITVEEVRTAENAAYGSSWGSTSSSEDVTVIEDEIVEEHAPSDPRVLTSGNDRGHFALQHIQSFYRDHGLSIPTDVNEEQVLLKDVLQALGLSHDGAESLLEHRECEANKAKLEASLQASESRLFDAQ